MTEYRLTADTWMRIRPDTIDDRSPRIDRLMKGDLVPGVTDQEIEYLTTGARPHLVEADSDADPFKDNPNYKHVGSANPALDAGKKESTATKTDSASK